MSPGNQSKETPGRALDIWLILMIIIGLIIVSICTFDIHILTKPLMLTHGEAWELGAVAWSSIFFIYYFARMPWTGNSTFDKFLALIICLGIPVTSALAIYYIFEHKYWLHFIWVCCIGVLFSLADVMLWKLHSARNHRQMYCESFCIGDLPLIVGFGVLMLYMHSDVEAPEVFVAGAISFQLLVSNVLFVLSQAGVIRRIWESQAPDKLPIVAVKSAVVG